MGRSQFTACEYLASARELYRDDEDKEKCMNYMMHLFEQKNIVKNQFAKYFLGIFSLREYNEKMKGQIEDLRTELDYRPDGAGAMLAGKDFELLVEKTK